MKKTISQIVSERILILDGAMGTMIQQYNLKEEDFRGERFAHIPGQLKGNNDLLCLTRPDVIQDIHRKYLEAGADIIETNTFSSTTVSMADYHVEEYVREMNLAAVKLARDLADEYTAQNPDKPRFVAGSVGPTNKTCSMSPDNVRPPISDTVTDNMIGTSMPVIFMACSAAKIAALAFRVSKIVSIRMASTPPSSIASICC